MGDDMGGNMLVVNQINRTGFNVEHLMAAIVGDFRRQILAIDGDGDQIANLNVAGHRTGDSGGRLPGFNVIQHVIVGDGVQYNRRIHALVNYHDFVIRRSLDIACRIMTRHADMNSRIGLKIRGTHECFIPQLPVHMRQLNDSGLNLVAINGDIDLVGFVYVTIHGTADFNLASLNLSGVDNVVTAHGVNRYRSRCRGVDRKRFGEIGVLNVTVIVVAGHRSLNGMVGHQI